MSFLYGFDLTDASEQTGGLTTNHIQSKFYPNGNKEYVGQMRNGTKDGKGIQYALDGTIAYVGDFKNDQMNGTGKLYYDDPKKSMLFNGTLINGHINEGIVYDQNGKIIVNNVQDENEQFKPIRVL
jgi:antitoxin component YwqK of YwqJK toxin-antitoxin module